LFAPGGGWDSNRDVKKTLFALLLASPLSLLAADTTNAPAAPLKIGTADADKHFDETLTVTGTVVQVTFRPKVVFLNLDRSFPDAPFTAVIMAKDTNGFGDLQALTGKSVEVTGKVKEFKDKPEIVMSSTNDLKVIEAEKKP
jgi:DNA/RNA endonuclease YhcR with UshA esterase domain